MKKYNNILLQYFRLWLYFFHKDFDVFPVLILIQLYQFPSIITQIQCLGDHKIVENG